MSASGKERLAPAENADKLQLRAICCGWFGVLGLRHGSTLLSVFWGVSDWWCLELKIRQVLEKAYLFFSDAARARMQPLK
jgi:hypothetical protein